MEIISVVASLLTPSKIAWLLGSSFLGIIAGALPGIGASLTMALLIPVTFYMEQTTGLVILVSAWAACVYGGSISSILINTPGTGANVATTFDGFPMARQGKAKVALGISATSSMIGGLFGVLCLIFFAPPLSRISVMFGPSEYFLLAVFGLAITSSSMRGSTLKGLVSSGVGLLVSFIGYDIITGRSRYTFGTLYLEDGIDFLIVVIGLFATTQILKFLSETGAISLRGRVEGKISDGIKFTLKNWPTMIKSALLGTVFGFAPGVGTTAASLVAYSQAVNASDDPDSFGKGNPMGVLAPETANNAVQGGALIPTLTLGIPGNSDSAVFLAGLMMYGLNPGRELFSAHSDILYSVFVALILSQIAFWAIGLLCTPVFAKITLIPVHVLLPLIWLTAATGTFALRNEVIDCFVAIVFGILGYAMGKFGYPTVPLLMGVILGPLAEKNFLRALMISDGAYSTFFRNYICWIIWLLIFVSLFWPKIHSFFRKTRRIAPASPGQNETPDDDDD
jgi:putative tricarboxylic transport membrane protein